MRLGWLAFGALAGSCACGPVEDHTVRSELRQESAQFGLALVEERGGRIAVIPFDGGDRYYKSEYGQPLSEAFGRGGRMVAWHPSSIWGPTDVIVKSIRGEIVAKSQAPSPGFYPGALNEDAGLLEFWGNVPDEHRQAGLHWATLDLSRIGFIDSLRYGDNPFADWSPDGRMLVYAKAGMVYVFDMRSQRSKALVPGRDPTWAPNGKWISFCGSNDLATLVTLDGLPVPWPVGTHKPLSPLRWTPDGRYVSFSETNPWHIPLVGAYYRVVVGRVSDGEMITARGLGAESPDLLGFHWILDYREFCRSCEPGPPFN